MIYQVLVRMKAGSEHPHTAVSSVHLHSDRIFLGRLTGTTTEYPADAVQSVTVEVIPEVEDDAPDPEDAWGVPPSRRGFGR